LVQRGAHRCASECFELDRPSVLDLQRQTLVSREPGCSGQATLGDRPRTMASPPRTFTAFLGATTEAHSRAMQDREAPSTRWARLRNGHVCAAITPAVRGPLPRRRQPTDIDATSSTGVTHPVVHTGWPITARAEAVGRVRRFRWTPAPPGCTPPRHHSRDATERGQLPSSAPTSLGNCIRSRSRTTP
jgi:hypothetical protein